MCDLDGTSPTKSNLAGVGTSGFGGLNVTCDAVSVQPSLK